MWKINVFLLALFVTTPAWGQNLPVLAGKREFSLHGSFDYQGPNGDNIDLRVGYGWYLRDALLLAVNYQWALLEDIAPGEDDYRAQQVGVELQYLFRGNEPILPYVGVETGIRNVKFDDIDDSGLVVGGIAGSRFLLNDSVAIDVSLRILTSSDELFIVDFETERQYVVPAIGIKVNF